MKGLRVSWKNLGGTEVTLSYGTIVSEIFWDRGVNRAAVYILQDNETLFLHTTVDSLTYVGGL